MDSYKNLTKQNKNRYHICNKNDIINWWLTIFDSSIYNYNGINNYFEENETLINFEKFKIINSHIKPSIEFIEKLTDILDILNKNFKKCWKVGGLLALDEVNKKNFL